MFKTVMLGLVFSMTTLVILLAGCSQGPALSPAATPMPSQTETATATPEPAELSVPAYLEVCQEAVSTVEFDVVMLEGDEDFTWGEFADSIGALVDVHRQLNPPRELREYHNAVLSEGEALLANARSRPGENSFTADFALVFVEIFGVAFEVGFDTALTDDEKEQLIEERTLEILGQFFGPDFAAAAQAREEAREALSEETLALLDDSGCYPDTLGDSTTGEADSLAEPTTSLGTFPPLRASV